MYDPSQVPQTRSRRAALDALFRSSFPSWTVAVVLLTCTVLFLALAASTLAQQPPAFGDVLDVRVMNLEVVVESKGERVPGLTSDTFTLLVDGEEVPIEFFTEVRDGQTVAAPATQQFPATPALQAGRSVGTRYLVFVDDVFAIPSYRNRVLSQLQDELPSLGPDDTMAIVAFDGQQVDMLTSWTGAEAELQGALEKAKARRAYGLQRLSEERYLQSLARFESRGARGSRFSNVGYFGARSAGFYPGAIGPGYGYGNYGPGFFAGDEGGLKAARVASAATSALRGFARPEGRKVMLLLSGGWPGYGFGYGSAANMPATALFRPLVDTANRLGYTLYPVDLNARRAGAGISAEHGTLGEARFVENYERERDWAEEDVLNQLAYSTGGKAFLDGAARFALSRTAEDTRSYYWIGFTPRWQEDDARHRVKVKVAGKGLKVRSREGFSDLSRQTEVTMLVESAQLFELPLPGDSLAVSVGQPSKAGYKKVLLPIELTIPFDQLTLLPGPNGEIASLELRVAATDDSGRRADIPVIPMQLVRQGEETAAVYTTQLKLRQKPHRLLVSVYDTASGEVISKRFEVSL